MVNSEERRNVAADIHALADESLAGLRHKASRDVPTDASLPACPLCDAPARALSRASSQDRARSGGRWKPAHLDHDCDCVLEHAADYDTAVDQLHQQAEAQHAFAVDLPARYRAMLDRPVAPNDGNRGAIAVAGELEPGSFLFLFGPAGIGKTHLAVRTAACVVDTSRASFWSSASALEAIKRSFGDKGATAPDLAAPAVLVLDDLGKERPTEWAAAQLYNAIDERYTETRTTIITSNYPPEACAARLYPDDEETADAFLSRLASGGVARVDGKDHRTEHHQ